MEIKYTLTFFLIFLVSTSCLEARLTLQTIYSRKGKVSKSRKFKERPYFRSKVIPTSFFTKTYFLLDNVKVLKKKNSDLLNQLVHVTVFKSTDFKFLRDQMKQVESLLHELIIVKKKLKSYLYSFRKMEKDNLKHLANQAELEAKYKKTMKKANEVITDLSLSKISANYYLEKKTQEASKLNNDWVSGKISSDKYAELRRKLDDPKKRSAYVKEDLEKQRKIISKNESALNSSIVETQKFQQIKQWNDVKQWAIKFKKKINEKIYLMKNIQLELKQKINSDI